jgi:hypothetical protein
MIWVIRCLALAHFAWGLLLVLVAIYFGVGILRTVPHLSSGTLWTNLPGVLLLAAAYTVPLAALGCWIIMLGGWAWTLRPRLHLALLITHGVLLIPGTASVVGGVYAMRAAARSTASGGGILSPVAAFPLVIGVPIVMLALCSIATALFMALRLPSRKENGSMTSRREGCRAP